MPVSDRAVSRYRRLIEAQRIRTSAALVALWDQLESYTDEDVDHYIRVTTPVIAGAKRATVATSTGFFALATQTRPVAIRPEDVPVEPRLTHPFLATWHALKEDRPFAEAVSAGRSQASAVGFDFVQSASRQTGDIVAERSGTRVRWHRVPGGNACEWCLTVAGQTYRTAASADFGHDRCDCAVIPSDISSAGRVTRTTARGEGRRATGVRTR